MTTFANSGFNVNQLDPAQVATLEKMCAMCIQALAQLNTPNRRIELRSGVSEVAVQWAPVQTYEGDTGWYFVANVILPMDTNLFSDGAAWEAVTELSDDAAAPFPGEFLDIFA